MDTKAKQALEIIKVKLNDTMPTPMFSYKQTAENIITAYRIVRQTYNMKRRDLHKYYGEFIISSMIDSATKQASAN